MEFMEDLLIPTIRAEYAGYEILVVGDPSGVGRSDIDKRSPIGVLAAHGIPVVPALSNSPPIRFDAVNWFLRRLDAFLVNAECETIIGGFGGGYKWKESRGTVVKKADKNFYSHVMDSVQYMCLHFKQGTSDSLFATSGLTPTLASSKSSKQKKSFLYV